MSVNSADDPGRIKEQAIGVGSMRASILLLMATAMVPQWTMDFATENSDFSATGVNPYFILQPGHTLVLEGGATQLTITVRREFAIGSYILCRL